MPLLSEPIPFSFILETVGVLFALIAVAIYSIKIKKENM